LPVGVKGHQYVILQPCGILRAAEHQRTSLVRNVADHHADHPGSPDFQAARQVIGLVI
jgi:hypothetical protein